MTKPLVLVTGAGGFIGRALVPGLLAKGHPVRISVRTNATGFSSIQADLADLTDPKSTIATDREANWCKALADVHTVVHLAGIAHRTKAVATTEYDAINHQATANLARLAGQAGVSRFVFVSSINAMGDHSPRDTGQPLTPTSPPLPADAYGASKLAAESALPGICKEFSMQWCIVRPPLVYGPGARGNLLRVMQWIRAGRPIPDARPRSLRSMIGLANLVDLLTHATHHEQWQERTILPADVHWSPAELAAAIGIAMQRPARLVPLPARLIEAVGHLMNQEATVRRLTGSMRIDDPWLRESAHFTFAHQPEAILGDMVRAFLSGSNRPVDLPSRAGGHDG